jgi:uncharacterized membrane protein YjdF
MARVMPVTPVYVVILFVLFAAMNFAVSPTLMNLSILQHSIYLLENRYLGLTNYNIYTLFFTNF